MDKTWKYGSLFGLGVILGSILELRNCQKEEPSVVPSPRPHKTLRDLQYDQALAENRRDFCALWSAAHPNMDADKQDIEMIMAWYVRMIDSAAPVMRSLAYLPKGAWNWKVPKELSEEG
jgi:hypothetical protein